MKILLTGATGYLGGRLAARLAEAGHGVRLLVRDPARARAALGDGFGYARGDLAAPSGLEPALDGCEAVVHTAAQVRNWLRRPEEFEKVNVAGSWALCEAALKAGVRRFVYTSSFFALGPSPDGRPLDETALDGPPQERYYNDYHSTKARAARLLADFAGRGLPLTMVFPTVIYGPGAETDGNHVGRILRMLQRGQFPGLIGGGRLAWNLAFVEDVVEGHRLALEQGVPGRNYILGGHDRALADLARMAAERLGVRPPTRHLSWGLCRAIAGVEEWKARTFHIPPRLTRGEVAIYQHAWVYSSARAERELGYRITPFGQALDRTIAWIRESGR